MLSINLDKAHHDLGTSAAGRTDYRVFTCLTEYMDGNGVSTVPQNVIAEETGYARRTVSNSVRRLQDKGFLTIEKTIKNNTGIAGNIYHINPKYLIETAANTSVEPQCSTCSMPCASNMNDMRRLSHDISRLHDVLVDVVADILVAAEQKESMK